MFDSVSAGAEEPTDPDNTGGSGNSGSGTGGSENTGSDDIVFS